MGLPMNPPVPTNNELREELKEKLYSSGWVDVEYAGDVADVVLEVIASHIPSLNSEWTMHDRLEFTLRDLGYSPAEAARFTDYIERNSSHQ